MKILYGNNTTFSDITAHFKNHQMISIPINDDKRANLYGDPLFGVRKIIKIIDDYSNEKIIDDATSFSLFMNREGKYDVNYKPDWNTIKNSNLPVENKLSILHSILTFKHGSIKDEYPEQLMAMNFLNPNATVLEIGGNIGRNSCIISSILNDSSKLLVLESIPRYVEQLQENRDINNFSFKIEPSALSKRGLLQQGWVTKPSDVDESGWTRVNTISWDGIKEKYNMKFDTLVADCEGALYFILMDQPDFLTDFNLIIIENDFYVQGQKEFVDENFKKNGFYNIYREAGGWGYCFDRFYEVWCKA